MITQKRTPYKRGLRKDCHLREGRGDSGSQMVCGYFVLVGGVVSMILMARLSA